MAGKEKPKGINKTVIDLRNFLGDTGYNLKKPGAIETGLRNFIGDRVLWATGNDPLPAGQGAGDVYAEETLRNLGKIYPQQYAADLANKAALASMGSNAALAREAGAANFTKPFATPVTDKVNTSNTSNTSNTGAITPASIAARMAKPEVISQREREMNAAMDAGLEYTPGQAAGTAARMQQEAADAAARAESDAAIESSYNPVLDFLKKQEQQTNARYAQNSANLKNIFGALTGIAAADTARINEQFKSSLTKQASDLAARTAEQRAAQEAGMAQLAETGAERGNGPALGGSPTATATQEAIGQSNAIQQNWEGLMGAQQANAITDIQNRGAGYGQQEVAANNQMAQNLQDALMAIAGQQAGTQSSIAQAKVSRDQAAANNEFEAAQAANKARLEYGLQELKNKGQMDVATLKANASIKLKGMGGTGTPKALKGAAGIAQRAAAVGVPLNEVISQYEQAYTDAFDALNPGFDPNATGAKSPKTPTKDQVLKFWSSTIAGSPQTANRMGPLIVEWADTQY